MWLFSFSDSYEHGPYYSWIWCGTKYPAAGSSASSLKHHTADYGKPKAPKGGFSTMCSLLAPENPLYSCSCPIPEAVAASDTSCSSPCQSSVNPNAKDCYDLCVWVSTAIHFQAKCVWPDHDLAWSCNLKIIRTKNSNRGPQMPRDGGSLQVPLTASERIIFSISKSLRLNGPISSDFTAVQSSIADHIPHWSLQIR